MVDERNDDAVEFYEVGNRAKGQFRCADCGYGVTVHDRLPACPMCAGTAWEADTWSPFGNARRGERKTNSAVL
jgi:hypothetical protein